MIGAMGGFDGRIIEVRRRVGALFAAGFTHKLRTRAGREGGAGFQ